MATVFSRECANASSKGVPVVGRVAPQRLAGRASILTPGVPQGLEPWPLVLFDHPLQFLLLTLSCAPIGTITELRA